MRGQEPITRTLTISDVKNRLSRLVDEVSHGETRVVVEKDGSAVAALVSAEDLKRLAQLDEQDRRARDVIEAMRAPFRGVSPGEIQKEADKAIAEVRVERRAERSRVKEAATGA